MLHPLGIGAEPNVNHHTQENRRILGACLYSYWAGTFTGKINSHIDTAVGMELAPKFVSLLDIGTSYQLLRIDYPDRAEVLDLIYKHRWKIDQICQHLHVSRATLYRLREAALDNLIDFIWQDWGM